MTLNSRNSRKFRPAKFLHYTVYYLRTRLGGTKKSFAHSTAMHGCALIIHELWNAITELVVHLKVCLLPYHTPEVAELCVNYMERKLFLTYFELCGS